MWEVAWLVYAMAGALSIAFIGVDQGNGRLVLSLMIGATFWNYLSIVLGFIAEKVAWERWEGTLEYTSMAPVRRWTQLFGSTLYAVIYGLVHTCVILVVLTLFFGLDLSQADFRTAAVFMVVGSASFIGIGMMAAILLDGVRAALIEGTSITELWQLVRPLIIMALVLIPLGIWTFGRAERYAKRTGRLKRVG